MRLIILLSIFINLLALEIIIDSGISQEKMDYIKYKILKEKEEGIYIDRSTGLIWQDSNIKSMPWDEANKYCDNLILNTHDDWYFPNIEKLEQLSKSMKVYNTWSSTPYYPTTKLFGSSELYVTEPMAYYKSYNKRGQDYKKFALNVRCYRKEL